MKLKQIFPILCTSALLYAVNLFGAPVVTDVLPNSGTADGGDVVVIHGSDFTGATGVEFGPYAAPLFNVAADTKITAVTPEAVPGVVEVTVSASPSVTSSNANLFAFTGVWQAYVSSLNGNMQAINIPANTTEPPITTPGALIYFAITPDGRTIYVIDISQPTGIIQIIDVASQSLIGNIAVPSEILDGIAITADGNTAYVTANDPNFMLRGVYPISLPSNSVGTLIPINADAIRNIAVTPDGTKAYVAAYDSIKNFELVFPINLETSVVGLPINLGSPTEEPTAFGDLVITPDGSTVYVPTSDLPTSPSVVPIDVETDTAEAAITGFSHNVTFIEMAPNGQNAYVSGLTGGFTQINIPSNTLGFSIPLAIGNAGTLFITPDSKMAYLNRSFAGGVVVAIDLETEEVSDDIFTQSLLVDVKITPDQAPLAVFNTVIGAVGEETTFDASDSTSPVGTIASYLWDFGDGNFLTTDIPQVSHTYQTEGNFTVTLRVINSAGTSTLVTYTGQMVGNNGGPSAFAFQEIIIPEAPPAPTNFRGVVIKNRFLNKTEFILKAKFQPSDSPEVVEYRVFLGDEVLKVIPATGPFKFRLCVESAEIARAITIAAVLEDGTIGPKVPITIVKVIN